jgi:hypothetical protein
MIRRQYVSGSSDAFPFRIQVNGSYVALGTYSVDFKGRANTSAVSYHLSAASVSATVISVPYTALLASGQVVRGTFDVRDPDGEFTRSEPLHITVR